MRAGTSRSLLVLLTVTILVAGCGSAAPSRTPSTSPAPTAAPASAISSLAPSPSAAPSPTPAPSASADPFVGQTAVTVSDRLRVRSQPWVGDDSIKYEPLLPIGTELRVLDGPIEGSGYVWYQVEPVSFTLDGPGYGWVAMAGKDGEPWIALAEPVITESGAAEPTPAPLSALSWQRIPSEIAFAGSGLSLNQQGMLMSVTRWGAGLVAVGVAAGGAAVWSSTDGVHWTRAADNPDFDSRGLTALAANGRRLVAGGGSETWTSEDAIHWTRSAQVLEGGAEVVDIVAGGPGFVMATHRYVSGSESEPEIWISGDGRRWDRVAALPVSGSSCGLVTALATDGRRFVLAGATCRAGEPGLSGSFVWTSDDARTWTRADSVPEHDGAVMLDVTAGPGGFVAVGSASRQYHLSAAAWTSADGRAWSRHPGAEVFSDGSMLAVTRGSAGFVAVGSGRQGGASWASPDGLSWARLEPPFGSSDAPGDVAPFGAGFVAVGKAYAAEAIWLAPPVELPAVAPEATTVVEGRWEAVAPMPQARAGQTAAVGSDGTVYFFGGLGMRGGELSTVVAYDPATNRWSSRRSLPAPLVTGSAAVLADDGRIYIFGEGTSRHPVYAYDPATDRWTTPSRHAAFGAAAGADGRIYATFGGVCVFDPATSRWDTCEAREVGYSRVLSDSDGQIYVISDRRIWSYDTVKQQATPLTLIPTVRSGHAAVVDLAGRIWVIGGRSTRQATLVEVYDPAAGSWTRGPDLPGPRVSAAAVVGRDGTIYVLGGDGGDGLRADVLSLLTNPLAR